MMRSTNASRVDGAAARLWTAVRSGVPCAPVRDLLGRDVAAAYEVQRQITDRRLGGGDRAVGRKVGLTSAAVQAQLGVDRPDFGTLFASGANADGATVALGSLLQPRVEAEIALVLAHDLTRERHTAIDVVRATAFALPAIEIVDSRIAGWDISIVDTIADNGSAAAFVTGTTPVPLDRIDLRTVPMSMTHLPDGFAGGVDDVAAYRSLVSSGNGAACLGHPLTAVVWLADTLVAAGSPLRAGDIVLTGALGPMTAARRGTYTADLGAAGTVTVTFTGRPLGEG